MAGKIHPPDRMAPDSKVKSLDLLVEKLRKAFGPELVSVILHGSAAAGDHQAKFSDLNVLCVLRAVTPSQLAAAEPVFHWWRGQGNPAPLLLSESELATSADSFALEFHDIQRHHRILQGTDVVSGLVIDDRFYRAQVEHDLRTKLIRLRQKAAGVLSDKDALRALLADSVSTFCTLFRHALILRGDEEHGSKRGVIEAAQRHFGIDATPFRTLLDLRENLIKAKDVDPNLILGKCLNEIGKVIAAVDHLKQGEN